MLQGAQAGRTLESGHIRYQQRDGIEKIKSVYLRPGPGLFTGAVWQYSLECFPEQFAGRGFDRP
jgi:hypothetical protein